LFVCLFVCLFVFLSLSMYQTYNKPRGTEQKI
jgi:hypothetical protein